MTKKKNWFNRLKRFFGSETKTEQEKERRKRWALSRFKSKCLPVLPGSAVLRSRSLRAAGHEQSKHAMAVAVATAVAAEAAVAAAQAAVEVVRLTGKTFSHHRPQEIAVIKIQTAFRRYLARSALKALKGLVKLQALIRGQAVRRQTTNTFRNLQSLMKIQSQARASRVRALVDSQANGWKDITHRKTMNSEVVKADIQHKTGSKWDNSVLSQDEMINLLNNRREAAIKRERVLEYSSSFQDRRRPTTPDADDNNDGDWSWLDDWVGSQPLDKHIQANESGLKHFARKSFNRAARKSNSVRDDDSISSSPFFPSYMTPTASAKARFRSLSTPKQRPAFDSCSEYGAPCTNSLLSPSPSVAKTHKSPRPKTQTSQARYRRPLDVCSFDSECSLLSWDRRNGFR